MGMNTYYRLSFWYIGLIYKKRIITHKKLNKIFYFSNMEFVYIILKILFSGDITIIKWY